MPDPVRIARRLRRSIDRPGLRAEIAADVNIAVSTGQSGRVTTTSAEQSTHIRQGRAEPGPPATDRSEEQP